MNSPSARLRALSVGFSARYRFSRSEKVSFGCRKNRTGTRKITRQKRIVIIVFSSFFLTVPAS